MWRVKNKPYTQDKASLCPLICCVTCAHVGYLYPPGAPACRPAKQDGGAIPMVSLGILHPYL